MDSRRPWETPRLSASFAGRLARAKTDKPRTTTPGAAPATREREVLEAALALIAEQGYAGASLRKLAERLGMRQPSLYHYFASKEELVEKVIETFSADMLEATPLVLPTRLEDVPEMIRAQVFALYERPTHPLFVRAMFAISRTNERYGRLLREIFVDRVELSIRGLAQPFVLRGEIDEAEAVHLVRMQVYALGLRMMEEMVLFDERPLSPDVRAYADYVVAVGHMCVARLRERKRIKPQPASTDASSRPARTRSRR